MQETPMMASSARASAYYSPNEDFGKFVIANKMGKEETPPSLMTLAAIQATRGNPILQMTLQPEEIQMAIRRMVQVFIADSNENVPLEDCLLFKGEEKLTDLTDNELFFELDIKGILATHNEKRVKVIDKKIKDRTEYLEPAKVRDLKMVVVTVANL